jgi:hypothetical protein
MVSCSAHSVCLPFHPLIDLVLQWVPQLKRSGLCVFFFFGSAPSSVSRAQSNASDWYEIAREAFAELSVEQESVRAVFGGNTQRIYEARSNIRKNGIC